MAVAKYALLAIVVLGFPVWGEVVTRRMRSAAAAGRREERSRSYAEMFAVLWAAAIAAVAIAGPRTAFTIARPAGWPPLTAFLVASVASGVALGAAASIIAARMLRKESAAGGSNQPAHLDWFLPVTPEHRRWWVALALTAGITEEVLFRGFITQAFHAPPFGLSLLAAGAISSVAFGLNHTYQGIVGVAATGVLGAFFLLLFVATGNLALPIVLHAAVDLRVLLIVPPGLPAAAD